MSPTAEQLAQIACTSADTAAAFGLQPRVALLSYSTMGSGAGPDVDLVCLAPALLKWSFVMLLASTARLLQHHAGCCCLVSALRQGSKLVSGTLSGGLYQCLPAVQCS